MRRFLVSAAFKKRTAIFCLLPVPVSYTHLYEGEIEVDMSGKLVLPGFVDAHIHLESSLVSPKEFAKAVLPHGTTTVITDPHEIANVMGLSLIHIFHVGDLVPAALHKSVLPGGVKIEKGKLRGVPSNGMLCSLKAVSYTHLDVYKRQGIRRRSLRRSKRPAASLSRMRQLSSAVSVQSSLPQLRRRRSLT